MNSPLRPRATGRVTLSDVAQLAGVSPITVSRALRGERAVAPDLVAKVRAAADTLGYVPNPAARALASGQSSHVAVLIPMLSNALFVDLLEALQHTLRQAGFQTLIGITHYDPSEEETLLREQLLHRPAGLVVTGLERTEATRLLIAQSGVPCVHLMTTDAPAGSHCVGFSQRDAGRDMARHLIAQPSHVAHGTGQPDVLLRLRHGALGPELPGQRGPCGVVATGDVACIDQAQPQQRGTRRVVRQRAARQHPGLELRPRGKAMLARQAPLRVVQAQVGACGQGQWRQARQCGGQSFAAAAPLAWAPCCPTSLKSACPWSVRGPAPMSCA